MRSLTTIQGAVKASGVTLLFSFIAASTIFRSASYHTGLREFGWGALCTVCCLYVPWAIFAVVAVALQWRTVGKGFWLLFSINMGIVALLITDLITHFRDT
jgi:hypothetical protein